MWCDTRCKDICDEFEAAHGNRFKAITGLPVSSYFSLFKILWLKKNVAEVKRAIEEDRIKFGTIDSWLVYNLTGKYVTDASNASRTFLSNLQGQWDSELLNIAGLKQHMLPRIVDSFEEVGTVKEGPLQGIPICSMLGDQQSSAYAQ